MPRRVTRVGWIATGFASIGVGGVGIVVPGLPTTVFFVFATWCFSRSSPRLEAWILDLPVVGPMVADHRDGLGMPRHAKAVAAVMIAVAVGASAVAVDRSWVAIAIITTGLTGIGWIVLKVPTRRD